MAIATYQDPFDLKERRENLSLDQGPSDVILAESKGLTKAGLMTPSGTSQDPVDIAVGPQPVFDDLNDREKESRWELEKIGYKAKLERMAGIVNDIDDDTDKTIIGKNRLPEVTNKNSGDDYTVIEDKVAASLGDTKRDDLTLFPDDTERLKNFLSQVDPTKQGSRKMSLDDTAGVELFRRYLAKGAPRTGSPEDIDKNKLRDSLSSLYTMDQMNKEADLPKSDPDANDPRRGVYGDFRGTQKNAGLKESLVETRSGNFATKKAEILRKGTKFGGYVEHSNFKQPIVEGGLRGNSRLAFDADIKVQNKVIDLIVEESKAQGLSAKETAMTLAIARHESGFNPDAASNLSSASGVGQFINETGDHFGLDDNNRWDANAQVKALVAHTKTTYNYVRRTKRPLSWVYKIHHDGYDHADPKGLRIAEQSILPVYNEMLKTIMKKTGFSPHAGTSEDESDLAPTKSLVPKRRIQSEKRNN